MKTIDCWIRVIRKSSLHWTRHVERSTLNFQFIRFSLLNWTINNINASFTWIGFSSVNKSKRLALTLFPLSSHYFLFTFLEFRFNVGSVCALVLSMYVCVCRIQNVYLYNSSKRQNREKDVRALLIFFLYSLVHIDFYVFSLRIAVYLLLCTPPHWHFDIRFTLHKQKAKSIATQMLNTVHIDLAAAAADRRRETAEIV